MRTRLCSLLLQLSSLHYLGHAARARTGFSRSCVATATESRAEAAQQPSAEDETSRPGSRASGTPHGAAPFLSYTASTLPPSLMYAPIRPCASCHCTAPAPSLSISPRRCQCHWDHVAARLLIKEAATVRCPLGGAEEGRASAEPSAFPSVYLCRAWVSAGLHVLLVSQRCPGQISARWLLAFLLRSGCAPRRCHGRAPRRGRRESGSPRIFRISQPAVPPRGTARHGMACFVFCASVDSAPWCWLRGECGAVRGGMGHPISCTACRVLSRCGMFGHFCRISNKEMFGRCVHHGRGCVIFPAFLVVLLPRLKSFLLACRMHVLDS